MQVFVMYYIYYFITSSEKRITIRDGQQKVLFISILNEPSIIFLFLLSQKKKKKMKKRPVQKKRVWATTEIVLVI